VPPHGAFRWPSIRPSRLTGSLSPSSSPPTRAASPKAVSSSGGKPTSSTITSSSGAAASGASKAGRSGAPAPTGTATAVGAGEGANVDAGGASLAEQETRRAVERELAAAQPRAVDLRCYGRLLAGRAATGAEGDGKWSLRLG